MVCISSMVPLSFLFSFSDVSSSYAPVSVSDPDDDLSVGGEYSFTNRNTNYAIIPNTLADNVIDRIKEGMASASYGRLL